MKVSVSLFGFIPISCTAYPSMVAGAHGRRRSHMAGGGVTWQEAGSLGVLPVIYFGC